MTREAFEISERFHVPVVVRLVTRLAHSRAVVSTQPMREQNPLPETAHDPGWILLPGHARRQWRQLLDQQAEMQAWVEGSSYHESRHPRAHAHYGVITCGLARNYYLENVPDLVWQVGDGLGHSGRLGKGRREFFDVLASLAEIANRFHGSLQLRQGCVERG